jgi:hypothetical protein
VFTVGVPVYVPVFPLRRFMDSSEFLVIHHAGFLKFKEAGSFNAGVIV